MSAPEQQQAKRRHVRISTTSDAISEKESWSHAFRHKRAASAASNVSDVTRPQKPHVWNTVSPVASVVHTAISCALNVKWVMTRMKPAPTTSSAAPIDASAYTRISGRRCVHAAVIPNTSIRPAVR